MATIVTREEMETKLRGVFPTDQAESLVHLFDSFREMEIQRAADTQDLKQGLTALTEQVTKLAEGQAKTDESVRELSISVHELSEAQKKTDICLLELAQGQAKTDQILRELAEGQAKTDQSVRELAEAMGELAKAQKETMGEVRNLQIAFEEMGKAFGSLTNTFGFSLEEFVSALLPPYLERHNGISDLTTFERAYVPGMRGQLEEIDLVAEGLRGGEKVAVLVECRTSAGASEVRRLAAKLEGVAPMFPDRKVIKIIVAMNIHPSAEAASRETGVWVLPYRRIYREQ